MHFVRKMFQNNFLFLKQKMNAVHLKVGLEK